jgi:hypothetical protein
MKNILKDILVGTIILLEFKKSLRKNFKKKIIFFFYYLLNIYSEKF